MYKYSTCPLLTELPLHYKLYIKRSKFHHKTGCWSSAVELPWFILYDVIREYDIFRYITYTCNIVIYHTKSVSIR